MLMTIQRSMIIIYLFMAYLNSISNFTYIVRYTLIHGSDTIVAQYFVYKRLKKAEKL